MVKTGKTRTKKSRSRSQKFKKAVLGRPQGAIQKRVQAVGPEKFGIVAIDCAKARSKWMLTDFYGNILSPPANVEHDRSSFQLAVLTLKQAIEKHDIKDIIVAIEMTGTYQKPPIRAFRKSGYETRLFPPSGTSSRLACQKRHLKPPARQYLKSLLSFRNCVPETQLRPCRSALGLNPPPEPSSPSP